MSEVTTVLLSDYQPISIQEVRLLPWLFAVLLVLLLFASPYPLSEWTWNNVPGGNAWYFIAIAVTVGLFIVRRP